MKHVAEARRDYHFHNPKADADAPTPPQLVKPTDEEASAFAANEAVNSPDIWLDKAGDADDANGKPAIDPAVLTQSQGCMEAVHNVLEAEHLFAYVLNKGGGAQNGMLHGLAVRDPDGEALCGGKDVFAHYKALASVFFSSSLKITDYRNY